MVFFCCGCPYLEWTSDVRFYLVVGMMDIGSCFCFGYLVTDKILSFGVLS